MPSTRTRPDSLTGSLDRERLFGLVWVHPTVAFSPLGSGSVTLGRDDDCDIGLQSTSASRVHARIDSSGPLRVVCDGGSKNGTRHNGRRVEKAPLSDNDVLRLGDHVAVVVCLDSHDFDQEHLFDEPSPGLLLGPRSRPTWQRLRELASTKLPVVLEGPTGTGKEVFAKALHQTSGRRGEFVAVNCAAVPETLAESQFFGQARGAFTGASQSTQGVLEASSGGTLLLDEIVDLSAQVQAKLLRALEESQVTRVGETKPRPLDLRIVAATQVPLFDLVDSGQFRGDLFARLAGGTVRLLPLEERREEIPALFNRFLTQAGRARQPLSAGFVESLCLQQWPLNTRQVAQVAAQAAVVHAPSDKLRSSDLQTLMSRIYGERRMVVQSSWLAPAAAPSASEPAPSPEELSPLGTRRAAWFARHREDLTALLGELERNRGNVSRAAKTIGISRQQANRLLTVHAALTAQARPRTP